MKKNSKDLLEKRKTLNLSLRVLAVIFLVFGFTLFTPAKAHAETTQGLTQDVYTIPSDVLPDRVDTYTLCNTSVVQDINFDVGGGVVAGCQEDFVLIHWHGYITLPVDGEITFQSYADDGFHMTIGDAVVIDNWWLKGCSGGQGTHTFEAGVSQPISIFWYEWGGGACSLLYYNDPTTGFTLTNPSMFTTEPVVPVIPPFLNPPINVQTSVDENNITVTWENPEDSGTAIERYALFWTYDDMAGWAVGVTGNTYTLTSLPENKEIRIWLRSDNDTVPVYSPNTEIVVATTGTIYVPPPPPPEPPVEPEIPDPPVIPTEPEEPPTVPTEPEKPIIEPVLPEPPTPSESLNNLIDIPPSEMTEAQVEELKEVAIAVLESTEQGSPEYEAALDALFVAAQADDIEVPEELAAIPVLGVAAEGITNAINYLGNVGSDMSPAVREKSEKIVVSAVVVAQVATAAVMTTASVSTGGIRRIK